MNLKVRDRTNEELLVRKKEFLKICDVLDLLKIDFFKFRNTIRCYKR